MIARRVHFIACNGSVSGASQFWGTERREAQMFVNRNNASAQRSGSGNVYAVLSYDLPADLHCDNCEKGFPTDAGTPGDWAPCCGEGAALRVDVTA